MNMMQAMGRAEGAWVLLLAALGAIGCGSDTADVGELTSEANRSNSDGSGGASTSGTSRTSSGSATTRGGDTTSNTTSGGGSASTRGGDSTSNTSGGPHAPPRTCDDLGDALDARWVLFDSDAGTGESERRIYAIEAKAGAVPQPLTPENVIAREPALSPDGTELAYVADGMVRILNLGSGHDEEVVAGDQPAWSPDGKSLAYHADRGVWLLDREDQVASELVSCQECNLGGYQNPEFSREGDVLVMDRENQIDLLDLDTGEMHRVVQNWTLVMTHPTLSPDARKVIASVHCEDLGFSLWVHKAGATTNPCEGQRLIPDGPFRNPTWGPNNVIAFELDYAGGIDVVLYDMDAKLGCRVDSAGLNRNPSWAPHGWKLPDRD